MFVILNTQNDKVHLWRKYLQMKHSWEYIGARLMSPHAMETPEHQFVEYLRCRGQKVTGARRRILEEVFQHHDHFDAEELYQRLKKRHASVSRATVYRTLNLLDQCGLVRKMEMGDSRSIYEHILGHPHHDHLVCLGCGRLEEFSHPLIEEMQSQVCQQHSFQMLSHALQIHGFCRECQQQRADRP